jgi:molybdenum cofactor cytidylyltransferase
VILAAGASRRLGTSKQNLLLGGETLVERALRIAQEAGLSPVIVVLRPEGDLGHSLQERGALVVLNDRADEGMASSIRLGVNVAGMLKANGAVLMTCDQVALTPKHLRALVSDPERVTGSRLRGQDWHPRLLSDEEFPGAARASGRHRSA